MRFAIVTYGTADGKHTRTAGPVFGSREEAEEQVADCALIGDEAARDGRMRIEEVEDENDTSE